MSNQGFKYKVGEVVTHVGFLKPVRQPTVQRFEIVTQTLVAGPGGSHRFYYVRPAGRPGSRLGSVSDTLRVQEDLLAPLPEDA
jgi:hypothetical protein